MLASGTSSYPDTGAPLHSWLKVSLSPPFLEHLSFRLGNQLFFIRIEDVEGQLEVPGSRKGPQAIARACKGHACLMPMSRRGGIWAPAASGWGLLDAETRTPIDPVALLTDERIEMTDWELHDLAVQIVRDELQKDGKEPMSWTGNPGVDPAIWFVGDAGPEWVVVRAARYPAPAETLPANWKQIAERCAKLGKKETFLSLSVASSPDAFDPNGAVPPEPLWRGHRMSVSFEEHCHLASRVSNEPGDTYCATLAVKAHMSITFEHVERKLHATKRSELRTKRPDDALSCSPSAVEDEGCRIGTRAMSGTSPSSHF